MQAFGLPAAHRFCAGCCGLYESGDAEMKKSGVLPSKCARPLWERKSCLKVSKEVPSTRWAWTPLSGAQAKGLEQPISASVSTSAPGSCCAPQRPAALPSRCSFTFYFASFPQLEWELHPPAHFCASGPRVAAAHS